MLVVDVTQGIGTIGYSVLTTLHNVLSRKGRQVLSSPFLHKLTLAPESGSDIDLSWQRQACCYLFDCGTSEA